MILYAIYSVVFAKFNVIQAIVLDLVISLKPFVPFIVMFAVGPRFVELDKQIMRGVCLINAILSIIALCCGYGVVKLIYFHPMYCGAVIFVSLMFFLYCNMDKNGQVSRISLIFVVILLALGLLCTRAKYFGEFVLAMFFLFAYRPGIMRQLTLKRALGLLAVGVLIIAVSWNKIEYYFLTGNSGTFDPSVVESYARPVLYATSFLILLEFIPFGSGLGSFATYASEQFYSDVYFYYGIDKVYGLSPTYSAFICDAYYPSLAQFGFAGLILFICFWRYSYNFIRIALRQENFRFKNLFIIGSLIICFILIECTSGTIFTQSIGAIAMALYGMICAQGKELCIKGEEIEKSEQENILTRKI